MHHLTCIHADRPVVTHTQQQKTICIDYCRTPFFEGYKFCEWEVRENHFDESTFVFPLQSAICVMIEFPLIFGKTIFVEVPKIHEICSPQKKVPYDDHFTSVIFSIATV